LSAAISGPVDLESIDYNAWVRDKRDWFEREFPWIFELQAALGQEGIELDYPRLLIETGNIRRFAYPAASPTRILSLNPNSLLKTAAAYGLDKPTKPAKPSVLSPPPSRLVVLLINQKDYDMKKMTLPRLVRRFSGWRNPNAAVPLRPHLLHLPLVKQLQSASPMGQMPRGRSRQAAKKLALRAACAQYAKLTPTQQSVPICQIGGYLFRPHLCPRYSC
jgi:hypothetical protein